MCRTVAPHPGEVGYPSEDSGGDEDADEDEDGTSEFGAPPFDRSPESPSNFETNEGHPNAHHGDDDGGPYEGHFVSAESKADHQVVDTQCSASENEFPRVGRSSYLRGTHPGPDECIKTCGGEESAAPVRSC